MERDRIVWFALVKRSFAPQVMEQNFPHAKALPHLVFYVGDVALHQVVRVAVAPEYSG